MIAHPLSGYIESELGAGPAPIDKNSATYQQALRVVSVFHNASLQYPNYPYKTVAQLISYYGAKGDILLDGIGKTIKVSGEPETYFNDQMKKMASDAKGKVPKYQAFNDYLFDKLTQTNYFDVVTKAVTQTATQVTTAVTETSLSAVKAAGNVIKYAPYAIAALGALYIYMNFIRKRT